MLDPRHDTADVSAPVQADAMEGPGEPNGLRRCVACQNEFQAGEKWLRMTPVGGGYAIGVHVRCYMRK